MLIKHQSLNFQYNKPFPALFVLGGQETLLINRVYDSLSNAWQTKHAMESERQIIEIDSPDKWHYLYDQANSYSLFAQTQLLDVRYDKKTLDVEGKRFFEKYIKQDNSLCLIILRAPFLDQKQLQSLSNNDSVVVIQTRYPEKQAIFQWIKSELAKSSLQFDQTIPALIEQYTKGNLLACAQILEKIVLIQPANTQLTPDVIKQHLHDQTEYQLYELTDACLLGESSQALVTLRHAMHNGSEAILVLWVITQEIRNLIKLLSYTQQGLSFQDGCSRLKIWAQKIKFYQAAVKRHTQQGLTSLLKQCANVDNLIKSGHNNQVERLLELLIISLATGKEMVHIE